MCRFLSLDFEYTLKCPVDRANHTVRFQAFPQLRGHALDVVECDAKPQSSSSPATKLAVGCLNPANIGKEFIRSRRLSQTANDVPVNWPFGRHDHWSESEYVSNPTISRGRRGCDDSIAPAGKEKFVQCARCATRWRRCSMILRAKPPIRAVVITGGDEIFCAGADIGEMGGPANAEAVLPPCREFQILFDQVESLPQPVIAAVSGFALGGGCELALAADFRIASETARFGLPEIKIGAFPGGGGTQRLARLIGIAKAKEMILTGDPITAQKRWRPAWS